MATNADDFDPRATGPADDAASGPIIQDKAWGYIISDGDSGDALRTVSSAAGRFVGAILLMAAAGLWIMPDALYGADVFSMKLAAMVMFSVVGGYSIWAGRRAFHPEFQIDLHRSEIRIGQRGIRREFRTRTRLDFDEIGSVFLLRSKDHGRPTRLFLRLGDFDSGIEIGTGPEARLEALRTRLARDLSRRPLPEVANQPGWRAQAAA